MRKTYFLLLIWTQVALCGFEQTEMGGRAKGLGGAYVGITNDVWSVCYNVGGLATLNHSEVSIFYSPAPFGLRELSYSVVSSAFPLSFSVVGLSARRYGFELYREFTGTLSFATMFSGVGVGLNINLNNVTISRYGSASAVGIDVGILVPVLSQIHWGISAKNINAPTISVSREPLPQSFSTGVSYNPLDGLTLAADYQKDMKFDAAIKSGVEYWIVDAVAIRAGLADQPSTYSGGFGLRYSLVQIDYAFYSHQELGITHQASVSIRWGGGE